MFPNKKISELVGSRIRVEIKGEKGLLEGNLVSVDEHLNLYMTETVEIVDGNCSRVLGSVVLRGNNILLVMPVNE